MLIEEAIFNLISASRKITDIVGPKGFYWVTLPEFLQKDQVSSPSYPALLAALTRRGRRQTHQGPDGLVESEYEFSALSQKYLEAKQLADAARLALNGQAAALGTYYDDDVSGVYLDDERDDFVFDEVEQLSLYYVAMKFVIQHRESLDG